MKGISSLVFIFILFSSAGCKKNSVISHEQEILFQFEYVNYAWGYQHNGFIINSKGEILVYNNPDHWNFPDNNFNLTADQVTENLSACTATGKKISPEELQKYTGYIKNIASSRVTAPKNEGADAGSLEFICYQFSENTLSYKGYIIKMEGDYTCENLNFYSKKVTAWLKDINNNLPQL